MDNPTTLLPDPVREGISTTGPKRNWPLNSWYVAAHSSELGDSPTVRWISDTPIVLYRKIDRAPVALHDRCPHRWALLSRGTVEGDNIACPYHGIQYAPSGKCAKVPTQDNVPPVSVRSFPVIEQYGFIWVWPGDPSKADPNLLPAELACFTDPNWHMAWGYLSANCNFMQIIENVYDLTHFAFLHKKTLGNATAAGWDRAPEMKVNGFRVSYHQHFNMAPLPPPIAAPAGKPAGKLANRHSWGAQLSPGIFVGAVDVDDPDPGDGLKQWYGRVFHLTTPVSIGKTHYYWVHARDHGEPFDVEATRKMSETVFTEDTVMLSATQEMLQRVGDQDDAIEFSVLADRPAIEARRKVAALVRAEEA